MVSYSTTADGSIILRAFCRMLLHIHIVVELNGEPFREYFSGTRIDVCDELKMSIRAISGCHSTLVAMQDGLTFCDQTEGFTGQRKPEETVRGKERA